MDNCKFCDNELKNINDSDYVFCFDCKAHFSGDVYIGKIVEYSSDFNYIKTSVLINKQTNIVISEGNYNTESCVFVWKDLQVFENIKIEKILDEEEEHNFITKFVDNLEFA